METKKTVALRRGVVVLIALAMLTAVEYWFALENAAAAVMLGIGALKAIVVLNYFMHIARLFAAGEGGEE